MAPRTAGELRAAFREFFEARGHTGVPSAGLIPHDPTVLFTVAGMVPFKPYFVGDEIPPYSRAVSVQKCVRVGGKHNDLDDIGRTNRHFSFFEMLGNFSFGDYFKEEAIRWAWELLTDVLELDPERLWVTVHVTDDDAAAIWRRGVGVPAARIQRLDEDNFWRMADTGPCGPSSEIFWDLGERFGAGGGPADGDPDRYVELWNLVFMQSDQRADGIVPLPRPSIDTGAGLERNLMALQGVESIFDIDVLAPLVAAAERATGVRYGRDPTLDVSLRILAEHSRTMAFLVADGVVPSNEERGYVLRRIIRRAVRHAYLLGAQQVVTPTLVDATIAVMSDAYPELHASAGPRHEDGHPGRGTVPRHPRAGPRPPRRPPPGRRCRRPGRVLPPRLARVPRRPHPGDRGGARPHRRRRRLRITDGSATGTGRVGTESQHRPGRHGDRRVPRAARRGRPDRVHRPGRVRDPRRGRPRPPRRRRPRPLRLHGGRRGGARPDPLLRRSRRAGRRHRDPHRRARHRPRARHHLRAPRPRRAPRRGHRRGAHRR